MNTAYLTSLKCPARVGPVKCSAQLTVSEEKLRPIYALPGELTHGLLVCDSCPSTYLVICGVAILMPHPTSYLLSNWKRIVCASLSMGILLPTVLVDYVIQEGLHLGEALTSYESEGSDASNNGCYLALHYGEFGELINNFHSNRDGAARILRPIGEEPNVMDIAADLITSAASATTTAVDVGCSVGGLARRLSRSFSRVWGFDTDFNSVLTARCINLGTPTSVDSFLLRMEGRSYARVGIKLKDVRENMEFVVADAASPPFDSKSFDAVACSNLVDVAKAPREVVREVVQMINDGGCVMFSSPWFWGVSGSLVEDWFVAKQGSSLSTFIDHLITDHELVVVDKAEQLVWPLWIYKGHVRLFFDDLVVAQRRIHGLDTIKP